MDGLILLRELWWNWVFEEWAQDWETYNINQLTILFPKINSCKTKKKGKKQAKEFSKVEYNIFHVMPHVLAAEKKSWTQVKKINEKKQQEEL